MTHRTPIRRVTAAAALTVALTLSACSGTSDDTGSAASQSTGPSATQSAEPTVYTSHSARVDEVLSGDTLRVTITGDSVGGKTVERAEPDYEELVIRVKGIDAPDEGECGFDEATAQMASYVPLDGTDSWRIDAVDDGTGANLADEDEHLVFEVYGFTLPASGMLATGYAQVWTPAGQKADYDDGQDEIKAQEAGAGLWATCFAE